MNRFFASLSRLRAMVWLALLILIVFGMYSIYVRTGLDEAQQIRKDINQLIARLPALKKELAQAESNYKPTVGGRLDDLTLDAEKLLRGLPGVAEVRNNSLEVPKARLVHFLDHYHAKREEFGAQMQAKQANITPALLDLMHRRLLLEVEAVQAEQLAALRTLVKHHGLTVAWAGLLTKEAHADYLATQQALRQTEAKDLGTAELRETVLQYGALGSLFRQGLLQDVLPAEDAARLAEARSPLNVAAQNERAKAIANNVLARDKCAVLVLGGAHELGPFVPEGVQYLRVAVASYQSIASN